MSIATDLTAIKNKADGLASNKITNFAYDSTAYTENTVASPESYDWSQHNNIPQQTISAMKMTETFIDKGWRLRFPILNKYFFNAFFGRVSYNLNKLTDFFASAMNALVSSLGSPNGVATLDSSGRIPASQASETLMSYKGGWSAEDNSPHLEDGMSGAVKGDMYLCNDSGTVTFGTGNTLSFLPNDRVVYNGSQWRKWSAGSVRRVSEILPDGLGNVDLTQQTDITKILNPEIIGILCYDVLGRVWAKCTGGESYTFRGATYGNGIWVAFSASQGLWWSTNGKTWTKSSTSTISSYAFRFAYYLNGIWVAGSEANGLWWSEDGKVWTQGTGDTSHGFRCATYANGVYVASGIGSGMWWSTNGKSWTQGTGSHTALTMNAVIYKNGIFVAGSNSGLWWSTDGKAWTAGTGATGTLYSVTYGNSLFVAVGTTGAWWSADGKAWTQTSTTAIQSYTFYPVYYANNTFVAGSVSHGLWYSIDGKAWTQVTTGNSLSFGAVKYANSIWLAGSLTGGIYISNNGINWASILSANVTDNVPFINISFFEGMFVIGTTAGLYYSDWTLID